MKKRTLKIKPITFILIGIVILIGGSLLISNFRHSRNNHINGVEVINEIKNYNYQLDDNETKIYKDYFAKLKDILEHDNVVDKEYASLLGQLFISDFYNLDNKITKNDIGGVQFLHTDIRDNFINKAKDTLYKYITNDLYNDRKQELPIVTKVNVIDVSEISYSYNNIKDNKAYQVQLKVEYKQDLGYQTEITLIMVHENDDKLSIVELK